MGQILGLTHSPPLLSASGDTACILTPSPWRVARLASASWSHSFRSGGTSYFHPHVEADRLYFDTMEAGDYEF